MVRQNRKAFVPFYVSHFSLEGIFFNVFIFTGKSELKRDKEREGGKEGKGRREREYESSTHWFIPQMVIMARAGTIRSWDSGSRSFF